MKIRDHLFAALAVLLFTATFAVSAPAATASTVTLSATPSAGVGTATPVLTWSATGAASCSASGGWSGIKAVSGTQTLTAITTTTSYGLNCTGLDGDSVVSWTAPTANTDGSALTDLAKYRLYRGATIATLAPFGADLIAPTTGVMVTTATGASVFAVTALNAAGFESAFSNTATKTVVGLLASKSVTVTITPAPPVPNPPGNLTVSDPIAYVILSRHHRLAMVPDGYVAIGTPCGPRVVAGLHEVPRSAVRTRIRARMYFAKCA